MTVHHTYLKLWAILFALFCVFSSPSDAQSAGATDLLAPKSETTNATPTYTWNVLSGVTNYQLRLKNSTGKQIFSQWYTTTQASCTTTCSVTPSTTLSLDNYTWSLFTWPNKTVYEQTFSLSLGPDNGLVTLTAPSGTLTTNQPSFSWDGISNTTHYKLEISNSIGMVHEQWLSLNQANCTGREQCSTTLSTQLTDGTYQWSIKPWNSTTSTFGTPSADLNFTVSVANSSSMTAPIGDTTDPTPTYTWTASGATNYQLRIENNTGKQIFTQWYTATEAGCATTATCSVTPTTELAVGSHTWHLLTWPSKEQHKQNFTVSLTPDNGLVTLISPVGTLSSNPSTFNWDGISNTTHYKLEVTNTNGIVHEQWFSLEQANCTGREKCSASLSKQLANDSYQWSIKPWNATTSTYGTQSSALNFSINAVAATSLTAPIGDTTDTTPTYTWTATSGATNYQLRIENSTGKQIFTQWYTTTETGCATTATCSTTPTADLALGNYTWHLLTWPNKTAYKQTFTVSLPPDNGLITPVSPTGTLTNNQPTFTWNGISNTTHYKLEITNTNGTVHEQWFSLDQANCTGREQCSGISSKSLANDAYQWSIKPWNATTSTFGTQSATLAFQINSVSSTTSLTAPVGDTTDSTPTYTWTATPGATNYQLNIENNTGKQIFTQWYTTTETACATTTTCSITPSTELEIGSYTWSLLTWPNKTKHKQTFTVSLPPDNGVVTLIAPSGTLTTNQPTFSWNGISNTSHYKLEITNTSGTVHTEWFSLTQANCTGREKCSGSLSTQLADDSYQWFITPWNQTTSTLGTQSAALDFQVDVGSLSVLTAPTGDITDTTPTYSWGAESNATSYQLSVKNSTGKQLLTQWYTSTEAGCNTTSTCSVTPGTELPLGEYTWSLLVWPNKNTYKKTFTVSLPPDNGVVTLIAPNGTLTTSQPTFSWDGISNTSHYKLEITNTSGTVHEQWFSLDQAGCTGRQRCSATLSKSLEDGIYQWFIKPWNKDTSTFGTQSTSLTFTISVASTSLLTAPFGEITEAMPTYTWKATSGDTNYQLRIENSLDKQIFSQWYSATQAGCSTGSVCSITPTLELPLGSYTWSIYTWPGKKLLEQTFTRVTPTITLSDSTLDENSIPPLKVGTILLAGETSGETFSIIGGVHADWFEIQNKEELWIKSGVVLDYETSPQLKVTLNGGDGENTVTVTLNNLNEAPTGITVATNNVDENSDTITPFSLGTLTATDPDQIDDFLSHTFQISGGSNQNLFIIENSSLKIVEGTTLDFETLSSLEVEITTTDKPGLTFTQTLTLAINDVNETPTLITGFSTTMDENTDTTTAATVGTLSTSDPDVDETFSYEISGGRDQALFQLIGNTVAIIKDTKLNYETLENTDLQVNITVTDKGGLTLTQPFTLTINDINEPPTAFTLTQNYLFDNADTTNPVTIGTLSATDEDANETLTFSITGGTDKALFQINGNDLQLVAGTQLNALTQPNLSMEITVTDKGSLTFSKTVEILVKKNRTVTLSNNFLPFLARPATTTIGTLNTTNADADDTFTYTLNDNLGGRFTINGDKLQVIDTPTPVFGVFDVTIVSTDQTGFQIDAVFTLTIIGFPLEDIPENPSVADMLSASRLTYADIYRQLVEATPGQKLTLSEENFEDLIIGKIGQQMTSGGGFSQNLVDVIEVFDVQITPTLITASLKVTLLELILDRLNNALKDQITGFFNLITPYGTNYATSVILRIAPTINGLSISFDADNSFVTLLHEDATLTPNFSFSLGTLIDTYNGIRSNLANENLRFFTGGGSNPPLHFLIQSLSDKTLASQRYDTNKQLHLSGSANTLESREIPTSQRIDYYFPGLISNVEINEDSVVLTR